MSNKIHEKFKLNTQDMFVVHEYEEFLFADQPITVINFFIHFLKVKLKFKAQAFGITIKIRWLSDFCAYHQFELFNI